MNRILTAVSAVGLILAGGATLGYAAAPDWSKTPSKKITVLYPGASSLEWVMKGSDHSGARGTKKGETCVGCHEEEAADVGKKIVTGQKIEPSPIKGKTGSIPVTVQAAHDGTQLYLRFQWNQPASAGGKKMDPDHAVKLAVMLEDNKVELAGVAGCWATCHNDLRTMPGAKDDKKTKYVKDGALAGAKFFDLIQWKSGKGAKPVDGHVAEARHMEGGKALVSVEGKNDGGAWTVTFTRKLAGGEGDHALQSGKTYNFGFAIHDDSTAGRYHHVSLGGYTLGIDAKADITAAKQ